MNISNPHELGWPKAFCTLTVLCLGVSVFFSGCASAPRRPVPIPGLAPSFTGGEHENRPALNVSGPRAGEEIWVIARRQDQTPQGQADTPGTGALTTKSAERYVPLPLKHTDVKANITGYISSVEVTQQFQNPYTTKIEGVYVFPLPENSAVNEFLMIIGERRIRGIIRERQEAEQIYQQARQQGYVASLLTQERPNVFNQSVANIEPGKQIDVVIKYFHTLAYHDGWYEFVFPMVVGPRFNPPGHASGIGAVPRGATGSSGQQTEVQYLRPEERSGHDISLLVNVDAGVPIEEAACTTHFIDHAAPSPDKLTVKLHENDRIPNKDFVLRYRVAGNAIKSSLLTHQDHRGGFFTLTLYPPADPRLLPRQPLEMVFVLDSSGSMHGKPIQQAKTAIAWTLQHLQRGDSFQLINFSMSASQLGPDPLEATPANVRRALAYLDALQGGGGTMMLSGIKAALDFPHDPNRLRFVCFMTDGYIGNETEIFSAVHQRIGDSRIFSFGVGTSVNRYLLDSLAEIGRGAVAYLNLTDDAEPVMKTFLDRISHPAMTDVKIDWGQAEVSEIFPRQLPDMLVGRAVILTGLFKGAPPANVRVRGSRAGSPVEFTVPSASGVSAPHQPGLPAVWARMKIGELANQWIKTPDHELLMAIKDVALQFGLMSEFTAFIAVDSTAPTQGGPPATVPIPVPVSDGVNYETTIKEK